ncbi:LysR family transcriptional regulator [Desulfuromonas versatilis]|uniref:LysR family transcriptional regulator n=1 Tax=Desulfuromonas versatilis TaxID=2802975 RepID=A0ABM8HTL7_9BACT|nr:LysR family transcriptional regulator [Desulfuromonas versatilis]BCR06301.1 LysR family transcriptional regulator [Desulfuromonas versatilis]
MINQQWLHTFLALVEVGHFTQTAEKLHMTQPGVSQQIKKLEEQVGVLLLNRIGKRFELTREGEILYRFGCKRRQEEAQLYRELRFDDPHKGECRIACSGAMATFLYPHFLKRQKIHPGLMVAIEGAPNERIIQSLLQNVIDLGIVTQPSPSTELVFESLGFESLCLVLPSDYASQAQNFDALKEIGFIDHPDGAHYADRLLSANFGEQFHSVGKLSKKGYINQINQILVPVAEGLGFTVLPEMAVHQFPQQALLYVVPLKIPIYDELFLARKKHRILPMRYEWFERKIKELLREGLKKPNTPV